MCVPCAAVYRVYPVPGSARRMQYAECHMPCTRSPVFLNEPGGHSRARHLALSTVFQTFRLGLSVHRHVLHATLLRAFTLPRLILKFTSHSLQANIFAVIIDFCCNLYEVFTFRPLVIAQIEIKLF